MDGSSDRDIACRNCQIGGVVSISSLVDECLNRLVDTSVDFQGCWDDMVEHWAALSDKFVDLGLFGIEMRELHREADCVAFIVNK